MRYVYMYYNVNVQDNDEQRVCENIMNNWSSKNA